MQEIINKLLSEMETDICDLQMSAEKANVMANTIDNDYFSVDTESVDGKAIICYCFDSTHTKHNILSDYVAEINKQAAKIDKIWNKIWEVTKKETKKN